MFLIESIRLKMNPIESNRIVKGTKYFIVRTNYQGFWIESKICFDEAEADAANQNPFARSSSDDAKRLSMTLNRLLIMFDSFELHPNLSQKEQQQRNEFRIGGRTSLPPSSAGNDGFITFNNIDV